MMSIARYGACAAVGSRAVNPHIARARKLKTAPSHPMDEQTWTVSSALRSRDGTGDRLRPPSATRRSSAEPHHLGIPAVLHLLLCLLHAHLVMAHHAGEMAVHAAARLHMHACLLSLHHLPVHLGRGTGGPAFMGTPLRERCGRCGGKACCRDENGDRAHGLTAG